MGNNRKILIWSLSALVLILLAAVVYLFFYGIGVNNKEIERRVSEKAIRLQQGEEAATETQKLIDEAKKISAEEDSPEKKMVENIKVKRNIDGVQVEEDAIVVAPGTSPISLESGGVINQRGDLAKNDSGPGDQEAPQQSFPIDPSLLPASTLKIVVNPDSMIPASFKVKANQLVSLAVTAGDGGMANFRFSDPKLEAVYVGTGIGETRVINFNAPSAAGEYEYYSDYKRYNLNGAVGKMIVE